MDTSVTLIGLAITALIGIPLILAFRSNLLNKKKIEQIKKEFSKNGHYNFDLTEIQNRKIISIDKNNKGFLFIDFSYKEKESIYFVNLKDILLCTTLVTTENKSNTIEKVAIELVHKNTMLKEIIPINNVENHFIDFNCLFEDHNLAKKWVEIINESL
jgi:hypothetical protein|nr:hypothetical protein [uncultured Flavobacterium sp.]